MNDIDGVLNAIWNTYEIPNTMYDKHHRVLSYHGQVAIDIENNTLFKRLVEISQSTKKTHIIIDLTSIAVGCIYNELNDDFILAGCLFVGVKSREVINTSLKKCQYSEQDIEGIIQSIDAIPIFSLSEFQRVIQSVYFYMHGKALAIDDLIIYKENKEIKSEMRLLLPKRMDSVLSDMVNDDRKAHDSYAFERVLLQSVREGDVKKLTKVLKYSAVVDIGVLVKNHDEVRQMKNALISATAIATRAAIEGGLSPSISYALSDYYIQTCEEQIESKNIEQLIGTMFHDFTHRVYNVKIIQAYSDITRKCITYINEHIRENINYQVMADQIHITKNYMLSKFKSDTKESMIEFVKIQKVKEAKELLKFSEYSIVEISELLSFSSQSFFTFCFHAICAMTPKQYRDTHKVKNESFMG